MLILDRYQPTYEAGSGGFATVIVAWDTRIQREVAIKCLSLEEAARRDPAARINEGLRNFENPYANEESVSIMLNSDYASQSAIPGLEEARTAALLNDQNIAQIYDFEIQGGAAFIIMELVDGISLYDLLEYFPDRVDADVVAAVFKAVSHALEVAHKNHVLHLDVKPDNVLINRQGQVKVVDFGLARLEGGFGFGVATGGTIGYMPPEQMEREELDERCDQWALASLTYEMLMRGENPFRAETLEDALATIYDAEIVIPSLCMEDVDEAIDEAIFKALDPDKEGRYASVRSFARDVKKALGNPKAGTKKLASLVAEALGEEAENDGASGLFDEDDGRHAQGGAPSRHAAEEDEFAGQGYAEDSVGTAYGEADDEFYDDEYSNKYSSEYDDYADYDSEAEPREYDEARANRIYSLVMRTLAFLGSALVGTLALSNLSMMPGWDSPVLWGSIAAVAVAGFAVPHVGALLAFTLVGLALVNNNALLVGSLVVVATFAWWYTIGRRGKGQANAALLSTCASSVGAGSLTPLLSAYFLAPLQALATTAFSACIAVVLAGLGSVSITSWDVFQFGNIHMWTEVGPNILTTVQNPVTWAIIGSWLVSAPLASLMFQRGSRALNVFAVILATAIICAIPAATSAFALGHNPDPVYLVLSIGCGAIALLVTLFAPPRH